MANIKGILLDADYLVEAGAAVIRLYVRTSKGIQVIYDHGFKPYFYVIVKEPKEAVKKLGEIEFRGEDKRTHTEGVSRAVKVEQVEKENAENVVKLTFRNTEDLIRARGAVKELPFVIERREHDITFSQRYIIDHKLEPMGFVEAEVEEVKCADGVEGKSLEVRKISMVKDKIVGVKDLRIGCFDIETYSPGRFSDAQKDAVVMVAYADREKSVVFTTQECMKGSKGVRVAGSELEMLEMFVKEMNDADLDVIVTYNGDGFDFPYLIDRMKKLGGKFAIAKDGKRPKMQKRGRDVAAKVRGRVHLDAYHMMRLLSRFGVANLIKFDLESVQEVVFGERKEKIKAEEITEIWDSCDKEKLKRLVDYNKADAEVTLQLGELYAPLIIEIGRLVGLGMFEVCRSSASVLVETLLIHKAFGKNLLIPNRPKEDVVRQRMMYTFEGGYVRSPVHGLHENIAVLDFRSLHPSIIVSHNIGPDTLKCGHKSCEKGKNLSPTKDWFCEKEKGFFSEELRLVLERRIEVKGEMKKTKNKESAEYKAFDARQHALKILLNSVAHEEPIVIRENNEIKVVKIGDFVDSNLHKKECSGNSECSSPRKKVEVLSFSDTEASFLEVKKVIRHKAPKKMYKVLLESGREITLTKDHGLFTFGKSGLEEIATCQLQKGTPIALPISVPKFELPVKYFNMAETLLKLPDTEIEKVVVSFASSDFHKKNQRRSRYLILDCLKKSKKPLYIKEISRTIKRYPTSTISNLNELEKEGYVKKTNSIDTRVPQKKYFSITRKGVMRSSLEKLFLDKFRYKGWAYYGKLKHLRNTLTELREDELKNMKVGFVTGGGKCPAITYELKSLFRLLGYYLAEGYSRTQKNYYGQKGAAYDVSIANTDPKIIADIINCVNKVFKYIPKKKERHVQISSVIVFLLIKALGIGRTSYKKRIPNIVFSLPHKLKIEFLEAYYEGDGDKNALPRMTTVSRDLANDLVFLVMCLGSQDIRISRDSSNYRVIVRDGLGFKSRERIKFKTYPYTLPKEFVIKYIKAIGPLKDLLQDKRKTVSIVQTKKALEKYIKKRGRNKQLGSLYQIMNGTIRFDRVKEITSVNYNKHYVYDLSVEKTERFLSGLGLVGVHNSHYGYLAFARARWYSHEAARSVAAWSRHYVREVMEHAEKDGFLVVGGDTDSCFLKIPEGKGKKDVERFAEKVNSKLPGSMELELEGIFKRGIFVTKKEGGAAKKRYALIDDEDNLKIVGFEYVRRDWSGIAKDTQKRVIEAVLKEGKPEKAADIVKDVVKRLKEGRVAKKELVVQTQVKKPLKEYAAIGPHIAAAMKAVKRGKETGVGSVVEYVITKRGKSISDRAELEEYVQEGDYDADYYINNQVLPAVMKILAELDYTKEDLASGGRQQTLGAFE